MPVALWLTLYSLILVDGDRLPEGQEVYLLSNSNIVNHLILRTTGGEAGGLILLLLQFGVL